MRIFKSHPLLSLVYSPQPSNLSYLWNFGSLLAFCLAIQIITGVALAMHYNPSVLEAFNSVEHIMRDVNNGWLIRYLHSNTASAFFFLVYLHVGRGLYYGSYRAPKTFVLTMADFFSYINLFRLNKIPLLLAMLSMFNDNGLIFIWIILFGIVFYLYYHNCLHFMTENPFVQFIIFSVIWFYCTRMCFDPSIISTLAKPFHFFVWVNMFYKHTYGSSMSFLDAIFQHSKYGWRISIYVLLPLLIGLCFFDSESVFRLLNFNLEPLYITGVSPNQLNRVKDELLTAYIWHASGSADGSYTFSDMVRESGVRYTETNLTTVFVNLTRHHCEGTSMAGSNASQCIAYTKANGSPTVSPLFAAIVR